MLLSSRHIWLARNCDVPEYETQRGIELNNKLKKEKIISAQRITKEHLELTNNRSTG